MGGYPAENHRFPRIPSISAEVLIVVITVGFCCIWLKFLHILGLAGLQKKMWEESCINKKNQTYCFSCMIGHPFMHQIQIFLHRLCFFPKLMWNLINDFTQTLAVKYKNRKKINVPCKSNYKNPWIQIQVESHYFDWLWIWHTHYSQPALEIRLLNNI